MAEENKKEYVPICYESPEKAYRDSVTSPEAEAFRASFKATEECVSDIQAAIVLNAAGAASFRSSDFVDGLVEKNGVERVKYVLASYIRSREGSSLYFTKSVREWARGVRISDSFMVANTIVIAGGDGLVNALAQEVMSREEAAEKTEMSVAEGHGEEGVAAAASLKGVENKSEYAAGPAVKNEDGSLTVTMPCDAVIRRYQTSAVLCMPRGRGYDMFRYMLDTKYFRENGDGTVTVTLANHEGHTLTIRRRGQEVKLSAEKLYEVFSGAGTESYIPKKYSVEIPADAVQGNYPNMVRCKFPDDSAYAGQHVVIPSIFKDDALSTEEKVVFSVPDYMNFSVRDKEGDDMLIPVEELSREVNGGTYKTRTRWTRTTLPKEALLHVYDRHTLLKMPAGSYAAYVYYLPNGMAKIEKDGSISVRVPEDRKIEVKNNAAGKKEELNVKQWFNLVDGKTPGEYEMRYRDGYGFKTYTGDRDFLDKADRTKSVIPEIMLNTPGWISVGIRDHGRDDDGERLRVSKFAVSADPAVAHQQAMYRNIGTDFDKAVETGLSAGSSLMGFCFSDTDDIVCLELHDCLNEDGTPKTENAKKVLENLDGTYIERSVSGTGLHIFGRLSDPRIDALSKDGEIELFSSSGYVAVTGDVVKSPRCLSLLDAGYAKKFTEENFEEKSPVGELTEEDAKILEKVLSGPRGDEFRILYGGGNVRAGKEFGDMSLAMSFSCASGGDTRAVMRLYNSSEREKLDPELLTHLSRRAVAGTYDTLRNAQKGVSESIAEHAKKALEKLKFRDTFEDKT